MNWEHVRVGDERLPTLIFLHGLMGSGSSWHEVSELLAERYCCLLFDLPGAGRGKSIERPISAPLNVPGMADELAEMIAALNRGPVAVLGYSMGGRIALALALKFPQLLTKLVIESANPGIADAKERSERRRHDLQLSEQLLSEGLPRFVERWYAGSDLFASLRRRPELLASQQQICTGNHAAWTAKILRELSPGAMPDYWPELKNLEIPALVIAGELDSKFTEIGRRMSETLPQAQLCVIKDAGHNTHLEQPRRFAALVEKFLSDL